MYLSVDPSPLTSTSCPPDIIHVICVPRPSPFSRSSSSVYYLQIEQKTGEAWERGYAVAVLKEDHIFGDFADVTREPRSIEDEREIPCMYCLYI